MIKNSNLENIFCAQLSYHHEHGCTCVSQGSAVPSPCVTRSFRLSTLVKSQNQKTLVENRSVSPSTLFCRLHLFKFRWLGLAHFTAACFASIHAGFGKHYALWYVEACGSRAPLCPPCCRTACARSSWLLPHRTGELDPLSGPNMRISMRRLISRCG